MHCRIFVKGLAKQLRALISPLCCFGVHALVWAAPPIQIPLANGAFIEKREASGRDENGDMIFIGDEFGTDEYASVFPSIAHDLTTRGWSTWLVRTPAKDRNADAAATEALSQVVTNRKSKSKPLWVLAQGSAEKLAIQWLLGGQVQGGILFNATPELHTQLNNFPVSMNGKLMELCASSDEGERSRACVQRANKSLPQIRSYRVPASSRNYAHHDLWIVNLIDGFAQKPNDALNSSTSR